MPPRSLGLYIVPFLLYSLLSLFFLLLKVEDTHFLTQINLNGRWSSKLSNSLCTFRNYAPNRYYGLNRTKEVEFLAKEAYVYGQVPILLPTAYSLGNERSSSDRGKVCLSSEGRESNSGTNPSLLSMHRLREHLPSHHDIYRFLSDHTRLQSSKAVSYVATVVFKEDTLCAWDYPIQWRPSRSHQPRAMLLALDDEWNVLLEAPIRSIFQPNHYSSMSMHEIRPFDDVKLFVWDHDLWLNYKVYDQSLGRNVQWISPVRFPLDQQKSNLVVAVYENETQYVCCGRNMGVLEWEKDHELGLLSQVDPIVVTSELLNYESMIKINTTHPETNASYPTSGFHGSLGFLPQIPGEDELLGIAHCHRPNDYDSTNEYSIYGHHYTHVFFTLSRMPPYRMKRLSAEFVFPAKSKKYPHDAEVIQFASGLEIVDYPGNRMVIIGYGINDCEAAFASIPWTMVDSMLRPVVTDGKHRIFDHMAKLSLSR